MSISDLFHEPRLGPTMWWYADLPAAHALATAAKAPSDPGDWGEFLLEWIVPSVGEELRARRFWADVGDGGKRRALRRQVRGDET
jgi:hypothetical protein